MVQRRFVSQEMNVGGQPFLWFFPLCSWVCVCVCVCAYLCLCALRLAGQPQQQQQQRTGPEGGKPRHDVSRMGPKAKGRQQQRRQLLIAQTTKAPFLPLPRGGKREGKWESQSVSQSPATTAPTITLTCCS